jgi:hypothetical protein
VKPLVKPRAMLRPAGLFLAAFALTLLYAVARLAGLAEHTSVIAGMPISQASWTLGPLFVVLHLGAVVVAPIFVIAGTLETLARLVVGRGSS